MEYFYRYYLNDKPEQSKIGAVYSGFHDFYIEGGWGDYSYFYIDHKNGETMNQMVQMAIQYEHKGKGAAFHIYLPLISSEHASVGYVE